MRVEEPRLQRGDRDEHDQCDRDDMTQRQRHDRFQHRRGALILKPEPNGEEPPHARIEAVVTTEQEKR